VASRGEIGHAAAGENQLTGKMDPDILRVAGLRPGMNKRGFKMRLRPRAASSERAVSNAGWLH